MVLTPDSLGSDVLNTMLEHRIGHLPVVDDGKLVGMITQTDLTRFQAVSSALLVRDAATAQTVAELADDHRPHPAAAGAAGRRQSRA